MPSSGSRRRWLPPARLSVDSPRSQGGLAPLLTPIGKCERRFGPLIARMRQRATSIRMEDENVSAGTTATGLGDAAEHMAVQTFIAEPAVETFPRPAP